MSRVRVFFISVSMAILMVVGLVITPCLAAPSQVSLDGSASGTHIQITQGDTLVVTLSYTAGTGFLWAFADDNTLGVLQFVGDVLEPPHTLGGSGQDIWTFSSGNPGTAHLSLDYSQPWAEGIKKADTFELWVIVLTGAPVPATSTLSVGLMIAIFAAAIAILGIWRSRRLCI